MTTETSEAEVKPIRPIQEIETLEDYLEDYGHTLAERAVASLDPLHVMGRDALPDFEDIRKFNDKRMPYPPQQHVIAAAMKMMDNAGSGFLCGQMGTGKTLMGMLTFHKHAKGKPYRAVVLCPDHLISVWEEELKETIPGAKVTRFGDWKGLLDLLGHRQVRPFAAEIGSTGHSKRGAHWDKPIGPEWYILGRNQIKWYPKWKAVGEIHPGFRGQMAQDRSSKSMVVARTNVLDEHGQRTYGPNGAITKVVIEKVAICPKCGSSVRGKKDIFVLPRDNKVQMTCEARILQGVIAVGEGLNKEYRNIPDTRRCENPGDPATCAGDPSLVGKIVTHGKRTYRVEECGEPLYNWIKKPPRWSGARIVQKKLRKMFDYLVIDEVHEQKSDESGQSMAAGKLMASVPHTLAMTGTLIGGHANHLFPLMIRMTPRTLKEEGFGWEKSKDFSEVYGKIDRIVTTTQEEAGGVSTGRRQLSMRRAKTGKSTEAKTVRPGVMPTMFGRHMIGTSVFLNLKEMSDDLPPLYEFVEDGGVDMAPDVKLEYERIEEELAKANTELLQRGSMKLLGTTLFTLLDFPDKPYGWIGEHEGRHAVGYYQIPKIFTPENYVGVVSPADMGQAVQPKEQKLIDLCVSNKKRGRQCWVYTMMTGKRNVQPRIQRLLEDAGLKVGILRSNTVDPKLRKEWIDKNGPSFDVVLSHPRLVSTGLTLFSKRAGGHNFSTIIFYETGYSLFDMRQAAARAWRIGQTLECEVHYLYYKGTMQHRAMQLMSKKMAAATALEGEFSSEGLAALSGEDNVAMAMAKSLSSKMGDMDMQRAWGKVKSRPSGDSAWNPKEVGSVPTVIAVDFQAAVLTEVMDKEVEFDMSTFGKAASSPALALVPEYPSEPEEVDEFDSEPEAFSFLGKDHLARMLQSLLDAGMTG